MNRFGSLRITTANGTVERDTVSCSHCQAITIVPLKGESKKLGFCRMCMRSICDRCTAAGKCTPFEKQLEQEEARARFLRSVVP